MDVAKHLTSTTFGIIIAFFLPGLVALFGLVFWIESVEQLFQVFLESDASFSLFLLLAAAALTIGLVLMPLRAGVYEELVCRSHKLKAEDLVSLNDPDTLAAFRALVDEQYRYHQFWGSMTLAVIPLALGWFVQQWDSLSRWTRVWAILLTITVYVGLVWASVESYKRYVARARGILDGQE